MKSVALIPARGGSQRVPNKNLVDINGKPLLAYSIEAAKQCPEIDEVWVSTDSESIAQVAQNFGAKVIKRPDALAGPLATSESALLHFTDANNEFDILVFMQATSPMTRPEHLSEGINMVANRQHDSVLSVCLDKRFYWDHNRKPVNYDPLNRPRSQDFPGMFKETGAFYITTRTALCESKCRISGDIGLVVVPELQSWEIDTPEDVLILTAILTTQSTSGTPS